MNPACARRLELTWTVRDDSQIFLSGGENKGHGHLMSNKNLSKYILQMLCRQGEQLSRRMYGGIDDKEKLRVLPIVQYILVTI